MRRLALLVVSLALALGTVAWAGPAAVVTAQDSGYSPDNQELALVDLINGYRGNLGLGPLTLNYELGAAADYHSRDMARNNYFDHYLFDGTDPGTNIRNFGYTGSTWGENIAAGMETADEVLVGWQNSPEHDAAMRNPEFTEIGIGRHYREDTYYGWYWTADFGGGQAPQSDPVVLQTDQPESVTAVEEPPSVTTNDGGTVELQQNAVNADGDHAAATGGNPVADGTGETVIMGDVNTGGINGETIVYEPPSLTVGGDEPAPAPASEPTSTEAAPAEPVSTEPVPAEPVSTDPTLTETTITNIEMNDGNGQAIG